jgi:hypothetical protein
MRKKLIFLAMLVCVLVFVFESCVTYKPVDVTNTMAAQINSIDFYTPALGEQIKTLYVKREGSFVRDLDAYRRNWYLEHKDKIVSIEAVVKIKKPAFGKPKNQWRVEYVDY